MNLESLLDPGVELPWHMSSTDLLAVLWILEKVRPNLALEIGTFQGGSLQAIAKFSTRVISVDTDPEIPKKLGGRFHNANSKPAIPRSWHRFW